MYGKVFSSIYDGTLYGHWEAIVTMQQLIVLCTPDGMVDMTPHAIAARTSIPLKIIEKGLKLLSNPDPHTRTPGDDGRRIVLMDAHRPWGWVIVNHSKYQHMQDADTVRAQTRERVRKHREQKRLVTDGNGQKRHSDSDSSTPLTPLSGGDGSATPRRKRQRLPASPCPSTFNVTEEMSVWAVEQGLPAVRVMPETAQFLDRHRAKGDTFSDWVSAWRTWIRNAVKFAQERGR